MPKSYPPLVRDLKKPKTVDSNPAIQLFGRRFFNDQTIPEFLIEFLLVATSPKRISHEIVNDEICFPPLTTLRDWPGSEPLEYAPKSRLNLKLFALLGASKLETRHKLHRDHYKDLIKDIGERVEFSGGISKQDVLKTLETLFLGFQRVGGQRTWCAQSFLPICPEMIACETIWKEAKANKDRDIIETWHQLTENKGYFQSNQHVFLARGGENLYLQICNALATPKDDLQAWLKKLNMETGNSREAIPEKLWEALSLGIQGSLKDCPSGVGLLAAFIDQGVDQKTQRGTDLDKGEFRYIKCGWCPEETWKEGYLFAVDLLRICEAGLDPVERLTLMETACAVQVIRSVCAQSARYDEGLESVGAGPLGYVWAVSDPDGRNPMVKRISQRSVTTNLMKIQRAIRNPEILENVAAQEQAAEMEGKKWIDPYKEADTRYGHKLFLTLAKRLGFVVPRRGPGARFVLTDHLLRYLVLTIISPGHRMTYDTFLDQVFLRLGLALGSRHLKRACQWYGGHPPAALNGDADQWVVDMLEGAGVLVQLSDSCSMVKNPLGNGKG